MSTNTNELFWTQVQSILDQDEDEEEQLTDEKFDELLLDPYNPKHITAIQQFILNSHKSSPTQKISPSETIPPTDIIRKIIITPKQHNTIDEFNRYLSNLIMNLLEYAEDNNKLFHLSETLRNRKKHKSKSRKYRSSYDEMMRHIPRHSHYAFNPSNTLTKSNSFTEGISLSPLTLSPHSHKRGKSKLFRSRLMKNENVEIISDLQTLIIDHFVNIESLKLVHDIIQLCKDSLIHLSFQLRFCNENESVTDNNDSIETYEPEPFFRMWPRHSLTSFDNNMMISCISSILKLCERMHKLEWFNFNLIDFNHECYDYFTHFNTESSPEIETFPNLKNLTIHIDDKLSQTEASSFPFYAFAASPILAFLKKLRALESITIIIGSDEKSESESNEQQYQFRIYFIKKLCEKIFEILNKSHRNLKRFYFRNVANDYGSSEFFIEILINFLKNHSELHVLSVILYDLCDENLASLIESIYYTDSKMGYQSCIQTLQELRLCSKTCIDSNTSSTSLRHHYGDTSLSALLHLIYNTTVLRKLSLICFYGSDTIKFNALISAINTKPILNNFEIAQLRKDSDTLYSLSKLFKGNDSSKKHKLSWNFYDSLIISFGAQFGHFYHGNKLEIGEMNRFIDLICENQWQLCEKKAYLLDLISARIHKNFKVFIPKDVLYIIVELSFGVDCMNISLLQWNLSDSHELFLLFKAIKYLESKMSEQSLFVGNTNNTNTVQRQLQWFQKDWSKNVTQCHQLPRV